MALIVAGLMLVDWLVGRVYVSISLCFCSCIVVVVLICRFLFEGRPPRLVPGAVATLSRDRSHFRIEFFFVCTPLSHSFSSTFHSDPSPSFFFLRRRVHPL